MQLFYPLFTGTVMLVVGWLAITYLLASPKQVCYPYYVVYVFVSLFLPRFSLWPGAFVCELPLLCPQTICHPHKCLHSIYKENYVVVSGKTFQYANSIPKTCCLPKT